MAYSYNNFNNQQGNYQRRNYGGNNSYTPNQQPAQPPVTPEQFIDDRIAIHQVFTNRIKEQGLDPADFTFMLGGWVTSYMLETKRK